MIPTFMIKDMTLFFVVGKWTSTFTLRVFVYYSFDLLVDFVDSM